MNDAKRIQISISLPTTLMRFLEQYQANHGLKSKGAVVERALLMLREAELVEEYRESARENDAAWDSTTGDGLR
jgi:antitoxin ParD1/3/4